MSKRNDKDSLDGGNKGYLGIEKSPHAHRSNDDKVGRDKSGKDVKSPGHLRVQPSKQKPPSYEKIGRDTVATALSRHQNLRSQKSSTNNIHPAQSQHKSRNDIQRPEHFSQSRNDVREPKHFSQGHQNSRSDIRKPEHFSQSHKKSPSNHHLHSKKNDHHRHKSESSEASSESESSELEKAMRGSRGGRRKTSSVMKLGYVLAFIIFIAPTVLVALVAFEAVSLPGSTGSSRGSCSC